MASKWSSSIRATSLGTELTERLAEPGGSVNPTRMATSFHTSTKPFRISCSTPSESFWKSWMVTEGGGGASFTRGKLRTTFSFPVAVATAIVLPWVFRVELQLVKPPPEPPQGVSAHVRPAPSHA